MKLTGKIEVFQNKRGYFTGKINCFDSKENKVTGTSYVDVLINKNIDETPSETQTVTYDVKEGYLNCVTCEGSEGTFNKLVISIVKAEVVSVYEMKKTTKTTAKKAK